MTLVLIFLGFEYMRGWLHLRSTSPLPIGAWRAAGFLLALVLIQIAAASPSAWAGWPLLTAHMIQHLLLMSLVPPLIWLAEPVRVVWLALPSALAESVVLPIVRSQPIARLGRRLGHPVACWVAAATALVAWHVPVLLTLSMQSNTWLAIEQASFLAGGLLFWWPVVQPWPISSTEPRWSIVLYLFMATLPCDALSGFLVFSERVIYPMSASAHRHAPLSALDDQQLAGALMWTVVTIVYLVAGVIVATRSLSRSGALIEGPSALDVVCDLQSDLVS
jgi:cytochrome c oxidase assembly factor CtaG